LSDQSDLEEFAEVDNQNKEKDAMKDWEERVFSDVIKINDYPSLEKGEEQTHVGMKHIEENVRKVQKTVKKEYKYSKPRFENGDTLFARITPCLENVKTAFVDILDEEEAATGSTEFLVMSATEDVLPKFVYYTARRPDVRQFAIKRMTGSSGRQRVPTDVFDNISITVPPLEEQEKIVGFLDAIDTKIETNDRIIELCDSIAQTIFSYWFESFNP
jgi:type I restriction enzyme S subunit